MYYGEAVGIECCSQCKTAIFETEEGVLTYYTLGIEIFCSSACATEYKEGIASGQMS